MKSVFTLLAAMAAGALALSDEPVASFPASQTATSVAGGCPNDCSGNGYCRDDAKCLCFAGYVGYDCSQRECPSNRAWGVDNAILSKAVECSYRGSCNRNTGECECYEGFEGAACERTSCPNACSGHGRCRSINELAQASAYVEWDAARIQTCDCDGGYFGSDCSLRKCPVGDDPQSICGEKDKQVQLMKIIFPTTALVPAHGTAGLAPTTDLSATANNQVVKGDLVLQFEDNLGNTWKTRKISDVMSTASTDAAGLATKIQSAIKEIPNFAASDVTVAVSPTGAATSANFALASDSTLYVRVEFSGASVSGTQPKMQCPGPFLGCPFRGCQPKWIGPRVSTASSTSNMALYGVDSADDWLPQPLKQTDRTAPTMVSTLVTWAAKTSSHATSDATFSVVTKDGVNGGTNGVVGSASTLYKTNSEHGTTTFEAGMGLRLKRDSGFSSPTAAATDEYHVVIPGCAIEIQEEADTNNEDLECAGRGLCDRSSGLCQCFEGYSGYACNEVHITI